jgi:hypothetical protein
MFIYLNFKPQQLVMKSKVLMLALATTAFALTSKAQEKTTFGVRAGVNFQNINGKGPNGSDLERDLKTGFHIGVNAEVPVAPEFYVQPGLLFTTKGAKEEVTGDDVKYNLSYLEIPINFLYKPTLGTGKLLLGVGPYVGFAVGGKVKVGSEDVDYKFDNEATVNEYSRAPYAKRLDVGGNLLAGYEFSNKVSVQLNAQLGMVNINTKITDYPGGDKGKSKNTGFGFSVGYRF